MGGFCLYKEFRLSSVFIVEQCRITFGVYYQGTRIKDVDMC
jgi:hypothetical protein